MGMADVPLLTPIRNQAAEAAILFVHGFGGNPAETWGQFPDFLKDERGLSDWDMFSVGYTTRLVPDIVGIWKANAPIDRLAELLYTLTSYEPISKYKSLVFVSHSMGGLVTQRALVDHGD